MAGNTSSVNVRQLCLQLKPILGSKADKIYTAYMAEDKEGQQQIEHYLQLLTAKYLPSKLEQSTTVLLPPSEEKAGGEYKIGTVKYAGKNLYHFGLREEEWIQHMAILGRSGAGKTNVGFLILQQLKQKNKPFLIFDWKRNYRDSSDLPRFVITFANDPAGFSSLYLIRILSLSLMLFRNRIKRFSFRRYCCTCITKGWRKKEERILSMQLLLKKPTTSCLMSGDLLLEGNLLWILSSGRSENLAKA